MYFGDESEPLDTAMAVVPWLMLMVSAAAMVFGVVNLFGVEGMAAAAAASLLQ
jgi:NADH-quinone oxidoreductase subunit N